ncbi:MAG: LacI family transcriptional regulator [Pleurocapsa minor GSE-CHR-MK-17-07R]|jgi:LacI family transcriptional regulator|nr:LacI family transcriptional regulator [Pleurocapsa minor GSE-CHR-MK 17-07R]
MTTIRDVAKQAGVSVSTVSHVLNGTRFVEPSTEARVRTAISALNYRPNSIARSLRRRSTSTIGLLVPDNSNPFFAEVARLIEDIGFEHGYNVILCNSDGLPAREAAYIDVLLSKQVDGLLTISAGNHPDFLDAVLKAGMPVVVVDRAADEWPVDQVLVDNETGGYVAARYLMGLGHQRIACIAGPRAATPSARRLVGFRRALDEAGIALPDVAVFGGDFHYNGGVLAVKALLDQYPGLTAVFATNDRMALGAISALQRAGLRVPADLSVIGFDNIPQSAAFFPALTTIAQPVEALARESLRLLIERINGSAAAPTRLNLETQLIERESCAAPAVALPARERP